MICWLNENQGVLAAIGFFLVVPLAVLSDRIIGNIQSRKHRVSMARFLINEIWQNLNFVSQIDKSYQANLTDPTGTHIPHLAPRIEVIEKFFEHNLLSSLSKTDQDLLMEIYANLSGLKQEYFEWRKIISSTGNKLDNDTYIQISGPMEAYIGVSMNNMLWLWASLLGQYPNSSHHPQVNDIGNKISARMKDGIWFKTAYKASEYQQSELRTHNVLLVWENDWPESPYEIFELQSQAALHLS